MGTVWIREEDENRAEWGDDHWALGVFSASAQGPEFPEWSLNGPQFAP